jgi:hypothetical protein
VWVATVARITSHDASDIPLLVKDKKSQLRSGECSF